MTTRTVQFYGQGYSVPPATGLGITPCTITATVGGNVVFSGPIATLESTDILRGPDEQVVLFTCEIPLVTTGNAYTIPVSLSLTGDDIFLEQIDANYCNNNGNTTGPTGFLGLFNGEARSNVVVTNATYTNPPPDPRPAGAEGTWGWEIETAPGQTSIMTFDMNVTPGLE